MYLADEVRGLDEGYIIHTYGRYPIEFVRGEGAHLFDEKGADYIDMLSGIGCASLGHAHPALVAALRKQAGELWQTSNYYYDGNRGQWAEALSKLLSTTTDEMGHVTGTTGTRFKTFFANSGAEANEGAIKLCRRWGERNLDGASGIVTARKSFHGRTLATLSATGQDVFHKSFGPMPQGFCSVPLGDIEALEQAIVTPPSEVGPICAVMLECIQGEGGVWPADLGWLAEVHALCRKHNILFAVDEVQTGFFRTGAPFAFQRAGIEADVVSMAKGLAGGFPCGAVAAREEVADLMVPGDHGSTFGGNALASAVGLVAAQTMVAEDLGEHVIACGERFAGRLAALPHVTEVRGAGLMRGVQLDAAIATQVVERGLARDDGDRRGLVLNHIGDSILRFLPPLVISASELDECADILEELLS